MSNFIDFNTLLEFTKVMNETMFLANDDRIFILTVMNLDATVGMLSQYSTKENSTGKNSPSYESDCQY